MDEAEKEIAKILKFRPNVRVFFQHVSNFRELRPMER